MPIADKHSKAERTSRTQLAILALIVLGFVAALALLPSISQSPPPAPPQGQGQQNVTVISLEEFQSAILSAQRIAVVMDVRKAIGQAASGAVLQCGVNLVSSLARINKTVESYAYDAGDVCYTSEGLNVSVEECERYRTANYSLIVAYGPTDTKLYAAKALIFTNENYGASCFLELAQPTYEVELPGVDPNATANTATKTSEEIFGLCNVHDYCLNLTGEDAQQSCLGNSVLQVYGDPKCCFGLVNMSARNACILSTAGVSHGVNADYCQFLPLPDADACYFKYATQWLYSGYCDRIVADSSLKADCYVALAKAGKLPGQVTQTVPSNSTNSTK